MGATLSSRVSRVVVMGSGLRCVAPE